MSEFINNASQRKDKIKNALKRIHDGEPYEDVKKEFADVLSTATAQEISDIEQTLIEEGMPVEDIQYLCDVHVAMFRESLDRQPSPEMMPLMYQELWLEELSFLSILLVVPVARRMEPV